jgi:hypothetical protein
MCSRNNVLIKKFKENFIIFWVTPKIIKSQTNKFQKVTFPNPNSLFEFWNVTFWEVWLLAIYPKPSFFGGKFVRVIPKLFNSMIV